MKIFITFRSLLVTLLALVGQAHAMPGSNSEPCVHSQSPIEHLNDDLARVVIRFGSPVDLGNIQAVSRKWRRLAELEKPLLEYVVFEGSPGYLMYMEEARPIANFSKALEVYRPKDSNGVLGPNTRMKYLAIDSSVSAEDLQYIATWFRNIQILKARPYRGSSAENEFDNALRAILLLPNLWNWSEPGFTQAMSKTVREFAQNHPGLGNGYAQTEYLKDAESSEEARLVLLRHFIEKGNPKAMLSLSNRLEFPLPPNAPKSQEFPLLRSAAEKDYGPAHFRLAEVELKFYGRPEKALALYIQAGRQGNLYATANAAEMFEQGIGTEKDLNAAIRLYRKVHRNSRREAYFQHSRGISQRLGVLLYNKALGSQDELKDALFDEAYSALEYSQWGPGGCLRVMTTGLDGNFETIEFRTPKPKISQLAQALIQIRRNNTQAAKATLFWQDLETQRNRVLDYLNESGFAEDASDPLIVQKLTDILKEIAQEKPRARQPRRAAVEC